MHEVKRIVDRVKDCKKCRLSDSRNNTVPGEGDGDADIMLVGEGPGKNEDIEGRPFVGRAGEILDKLLDSVGLDRNEIYITNIVKCRPPENRNPRKDEIETCTPYLDEQISIIEPDVISPLGSFATAYILDKYDLDKGKISEVHGKTFSSENLKIYPQYHPAAAIYDPSKMEVLKKDFEILGDVQP
ncbi:MAG: uracil-DNA glycosylase family protein [Candidatus Aenigmatarchaeota archaeon]